MKGPGHWPLATGHWIPGLRGMPVCAHPRRPPFSIFASNLPLLNFLRITTNSPSTWCDVQLFAWRNFQCSMFNPQFAFPRLACSPPAPVIKPNQTKSNQMQPCRPPILGKPKEDGPSGETTFQVGRGFCRAGPAPFPCAPRLGRSLALPPCVMIGVPPVPEAPMMSRAAALPTPHSQSVGDPLDRQSRFPLRTRSHRRWLTATFSHVSCNPRLGKDD